MAMSSEDVGRLIELAGMKHDPRIQSLAALAAVSKNPRWTQLLLRVVGPRAAMAQEAQPFRSPDALMPGSVHIGRALMMSGDPLGEVGLPLSCFETDVLVCGAKGAGKTYMLTAVAAQLIAQGVTVLVLDSQGDYAARLARLFGPDHLHVFEWLKLRQNFHEPVGNEDFLTTIGHILRLLREEYLRDGSIGLLAEYLHEEFRSGTTPSVRSMLDRMDRTRYRYGRIRDYWESLKVRYLALSFLPIYDCAVGMPLEQLIDRSGVIVLQGLAPQHLGFVIRHLMSAVTRLLAQQPGRRVIFCIDEAHLVINRELERRNDLGSSLVTELSRTLRHLGSGLVLADQLPGLLPDQTIGLTNTKVILRLEGDTNVRVIGDSLNLDREQRAYLSEMPPRRAVVRCPALGWPQAFLVELPELEFELATEGEVRERMEASLVGLEWEPAQQRSQVAQASPKAEERAPVMELDVSKKALDYLCDVARRPFLWPAIRDPSLGLSGWMGNQLRKELSDRGYLRAHELRTGRRGGRLLLAEITSAGYQLLERLDVTVHRRAGKGGFVHQAAQDLIAEYYRQTRPGATVRVEDGSTGKAVDVTVVGSEGSLAIEVLSVGENKELGNIEADLRAYDEVVVACEDPETLEHLREKVREAFDEVERGRVRFELLARFIRDNKGRGERPGTGSGPRARVT